MKTINILILCLVLWFADHTYSQSTISDYLESLPIGDTASIFLPNRVSLPNSWEEKITFSSNGKEMFFGRHPDGGKNYFKPRIMYAIYQNGQWSVPDTASFSRKEIMGYPILSPSGNTLFMEQPINPTKKGVTGQIVYSEKVKGQWTETKIITPDVTAKEGFGLAQITKDSIFYFHDRFDRIAYTSTIQNDTCSASKALSYRINPSVEFFVSQKNDYIIFKPLNWSNQFHISFKEKSGNWGMPIPFSAYFKKGEKWIQKGFGPYVSPDGNYFFFAMGGDIWWIRATFIEVLRKQS